MKRSGQIRRKTPLRRTGWPRKAQDGSADLPVARTPSRPLRRRMGVKPVSDKRRVENDERRKMTLVLARERGPFCQACPITPVGARYRFEYGLMFDRRPRLAVDVHEILRRSRGGSITDPDNCLLVCRECHDWITLHDAEAIALRLSRKATPEERKGWTPKHG